MLLEKTSTGSEINETIYYAIVLGGLKYDPSFLLDFTGTGSLDPERVVIDALWSHGRQRADAVPGPFDCPEV